MKIPFRWSRDEAIELCLEALATGCVYGVSANHDPDILATGTSFAQNSNGDRHMWRDWGLFEAHFSRWRAGTPWNCDFLMVQAHRIKKPPKLSSLRQELHRYGHELAEPARSMAGADYLTVPSSGSEACVGRDGDKYEGRLMKISATATPPFAGRSYPRARTSPEYRAALQDIAGAPFQSWDAWLDQHPWSPDDWVWHLGLLHTLHRDEPTRRETWAAFGRWLLDQARARSIWPAAEWTWRWADFILDRRTDPPGPTSEDHDRPADPIAPGDVARECLAAVPMTPAEAAALPAEWRALTPEDVRRSRTTTALLRLAAADVAPAAPPPALAEWQPFLHAPNTRQL